jgi:hypothetical protein
VKFPTLIQAALIAISLAGVAQAAAPAAPAATKVTTIVAASHDAALLPAGYAANPANGAFAAPDSDSEEAQPAEHPKDDPQTDAAAAPVPEPQMFLMMLIGLVLLGLASSRREAYEKFTD